MIPYWTNTTSGASGGWGDGGTIALVMIIWFYRYTSHLKYKENEAIYMWIYDYNITFFTFDYIGKQEKIKTFSLQTKNEESIRTIKKTFMGGRAKKPSTNTPLTKNQKQEPRNSNIIIRSRSTSKPHLNQSTGRLILKHYRNLEEKKKGNHLDTCKEHPLCSPHTASHKR